MITPRFPPLYRFQSFIVISRGFSKNTQIRDCSAAHSPTRGRTIREKTDLVLFFLPGFVMETLQDMIQLSGAPTVWYFYCVN